MECFTIMRNEIEGRIDPFYYRPEFRELKRLIKSINIKKLGNIATFQYGLNEIAQNKGDIIYIRITDIDENGLLKKDELAYLNYQDKYKAYKLNKGDILIARIGATFGKSYYFDEDIDAVFAGYLIRIKLQDKQINPKYLFYFFQTKYFWKQANMLVKGGAQPQFNANTIRDLLIPLPPLSTQNRIVQIMDNAYQIKKQKEIEAQQLLDSINDYVLSELGIKLPELKDQMTFVVYADNVKGKRIDAYYYQPKFEEIEKAIERGKYKMSYGNVIFEKIESGKGVSLEEKKDEGLPYIEVNHITKTGIREPSIFVSSKLNLKIAEEGDILTGRVGSIGNFVVFCENRKMAFSDNVLRIKIKENINKTYIASVLNSLIITYQIDRTKKGSLQNVINQKTLNNLKIPLPPLEIQNKIAEEVKRRMQKAEKLQKEAKEVLEKAKQEVEKMILG